MKNTEPAFILAYLKELNLKPGTVFKALIKLNFNAQIKEFEDRVIIKLHKNYFELDLLHNQDNIYLLRAFDSRVDIFTITKPSTLNVAGITRNYSYKASITPYDPQT
ncbi:MAG: hypothetical protein ABI402_06730 [Ferruginibacter sp.]